MLRRVIFTALLTSLVCMAAPVLAGEGESPRDIVYPEYPPAPLRQTEAAADEKSRGCVSCHTATDSTTMHTSPGVILGCTDCHGGNASVFRATVSLPGSNDYRHALDAAHVQPRYPIAWDYPSSKSPKRTYT